MEADYSKRELDEHFSDLKGDVAEVKKGIDSLNTKVGIQNGRVGKLETKWNSVVIGGIVGMALVGTIMGLAIYSFRLSLDNLHQSILLEIKH